MAMNANALQAALKTDLLQIFNICNASSGVSPEEYAAMISEALASRVVEHITSNAEVTGTAGPYPVIGTVA
jgi:hypothetical protein